MAEYGHILAFPNQLNPLHGWIGRLPAKIHGCQRAIVELLLVKVDFVDSVPVHKLYILISISEITDKALVSCFDLVLFLLIKAFAMARSSLLGFIKGLLDEIFLIPFYLLVNIS